MEQDGTQVTLATTYDADSGSLIGPVNLQPGQSGQVALTTTALCSDPASPVAYSSVSVGMPGGSGSVSIDLSGGQELDGGCGVNVSQFGVMTPGPPVNTSPLDGLTVAATLPDTLTAGQTVTYDVTIDNPTSQDVQLSPCPVFGELVAPLGSASLAATNWYYLNCQDAGDIAAGGSVTFQMQISVPATTGDAKFGWILAGTTVSTGHGVTISDSSTGP